MYVTLSMPFAATTEVKLRLGPPSAIIVAVLHVWMPSIGRKHRSRASDRNQPPRREVFLMRKKNIEILRIL